MSWSSGLQQVCLPNVLFYFVWFLTSLYYYCSYLYMLHLFCVSVSFLISLLFVRGFPWFVQPLFSSCPLSYMVWCISYGCKKIISIYTNVYLWLYLAYMAFGSLRLRRYFPDSDKRFWRLSLWVGKWVNFDVLGLFLISSGLTFSPFWRIRSSTYRLRQNLSCLPLTAVKGIEP